jgi:hypothetical protein
MTDSEHARLAELGSKFMWTGTSEEFLEYYELMMKKLSECGEKLDEILDKG